VERAIEIFALIQFLIVGLSHILYPRAWADFFIWIRQRREAGVFVHGFLSLGFGSIILAFHNVWSGLPTVFTVVGCLYTVKAALCFLIPATQMRTLGRVSHERAWEFMVPGAVYVVLGCILVYSLWLT
jgi:hypothetical protein